jgi:hypothetical protein
LLCLVDMVGSHTPAFRHIANPWPGQVLTHGQDKKSKEA